MQRAMEILHRDGLLAVSGLVDPAHVEALRESMLATAQAIKQRVSDASQYNHGIKSNFLMSAPLSDPDLRFEDVFANPFVHQLAEGYLGPGIKLSLLTANCAVAGATQRQNVHKDAPWCVPSVLTLPRSASLRDTSAPYCDVHLLTPLLRLHPNCPGMLNTNLALSGPSTRLLRAAPLPMPVSTHQPSARQTLRPRTAAPSFGWAATSGRRGTTRYGRLATRRRHCATLRRTCSRQGGRFGLERRSGYRWGRSS